MSFEIKCPVCGKVGIPDYHNSDVVCPCCGSDLKIYRIIERIPDKTDSKSIWKVVSAVALLAVAIMIFMLNDKTPEIITKVPDDYVLLEDSIACLKEQLAHKVSATSPSGFSYTIKRGDSFWSISRRFYGSGTKANMLAENNNRKITDTLHTGDVLIIK